MKTSTKDLNNKRIIIAPFNTEAVFLYHRLTADGVQVIAFMDKDKTLHNESYDQKVIIPYMYFPNDDIVIVIANTGYVSQDNILDSIKELEYGEYFSIVLQDEIEITAGRKEIVHKIDLEQLKKFRGRGFMGIIKEKICDCTINIPYKVLEVKVILTTKCTLKCEGCCHLMDYYNPEDQKDMDLIKTLDSIDKVFQSVDYVDQFVPMGGETFSYGRLSEVLEHIFVKGYDKKINSIDLFTNGTIVPSDELLSIFSKHSEIIHIVISSYNISNNKFRLIEALSRFGCEYTCLENIDWYMPPQPEQSKIESIETVKKKCEKCECSKKLRLIENRIYNCQTIIYGEQCHTFPYDRRNYLDIYEDKIDRDQLELFLNTIVPGASYCNGYFTSDENEGTPIGKAVQTKTVKECKRYY